jgi:hypothetical protein
MLSDSESGIVSYLRPFSGIQRAGDDAIAPRSEVIFVGLRNRMDPM